MGLEVPVPDDQPVRGLYIDELDSKIHVGLVDPTGHRVTSLTVTPTRWPRIGAGTCPAREGLFTVTGSWQEDKPMVVEAHPCRPHHDQECWLAENAWQVTVEAISPEGAQLQALAQVQREQQADPSAVRHLYPGHSQPAHAATGR
jgi:hypothetical protein